MAVEWRTKKIVYFPVPKCACTSLKYAFYKLNFGQEYSEDSATAAGGIHLLYSGTPEFGLSRLELYTSWRRLVVIRDPVRRFLSAYTNRVVDKGKLSEDLLSDNSRKFDVPSNPDIHQFIAHFDIYRAISPDVRHHFAPQAYFLGPDLDAYTHVYKIEELDLLHMMLEVEHGYHFEMHRLQVSNTSISTDIISVRELSVICGLYAGDYALLKRYYKYDTLLHERKSRRQWKNSGQTCITMHEILPSLDESLTGSEQINSRLAIYAEGDVGIMHIRHDKTLTITTSGNGICLVSLEIIAPSFLVLGESYELIVEACCDHPIKMTCFVRHGSGAEQPGYFGSTCMTLEPGHAERRILLETDVPKAVLRREPLSWNDLKFIVMFKSTCGIMVHVTRFDLDMASPWSIGELEDTVIRHPSLHHSAKIKMAGTAVLYNRVNQLKAACRQHFLDIVRRP